jgi:hypothetical protein
MNNNVDLSLVLELLKKLSTRFENLEREQISTRLSIQSLKETMAAFLTSEVRKDSDVLSLEQRVMRIERRLELQDGE